MGKITYAITVCNEHWQLKLLLARLFEHIRPDDQILIQSDLDNVTDEVINAIDEFMNQYRGSEFGIKHVSIPLNHDFGTFKNNLKDGATGDWIFQIDADEMPTHSLLSLLPSVIDQNPDTEVIRIPRINTVHGITQEHIDKWGWSITIIKDKLLQRSEDDIDKEYLDVIERYGGLVRNESGLVTYYEPVVNFPDYQWRLYQNKENINWVNKVHEVLTGYDKYSELPMDISWCLLHMKDIKRQEMQNSYYDTI